MTLLGIDMNSTRVRVVAGPAADFALPLPLEPYTHELAMILSFASGAVEIGQAGARLIRKQPHMTCHGFLPQVGIHHDNGARTNRWKTNQHDLDATGAMEQVWRRLEPACRKASGIVVAVPGYLSMKQAEVVRTLGRKMRLPVVGSLPSPLAAALAGYAEQNWSESVLVLDVDDHALSITEIRAVAGQAHVLDVKYLPHLGLRVWRERLINALADMCVLQSRRDPRASPVAEQGLYEQLDALLEACQKGRTMQLAVQTATWYQNLLLQPEQVAAICAGLNRQFMHEFIGIWERLGQDEKSQSLLAAVAHAAGSEKGPCAVLATHLVGRLPGLLPALRAFLGEQCRTLKPLLTDMDDFGDNLIDPAGPSESDSVLVLGPDAPARAAHALGAHFKSGDGAAAHLELSAPLPRHTAVEIGPARLSHQGQDFLLSERNFYLGCHGTQLMVDDRSHGESAQCELVFDKRSYILFNRSREVTLVNDYPVAGSVSLNPGDWIRLGYDGPLVRFLGQADNNRTPLTA